jgi:hypothetical protein
MALLSALATVAQGVIPVYANEAVQNAILQADVERTRLALERARMQGEDNHQKFTQRYPTILIDDLYERIEDLELSERDNLQYIDHLRDKKRKLKHKYKNLCNETDKDYQCVCFLEHTLTNDTEENDRKKFLTRWLL